jgi:hypothetical protein
VGALLRSSVALVRSLAWEQALILGALLLLFIFSFMPGWIQLAFNCPADDVYCVSNSTTVDSLWTGLGILPALIIVMALIWFVVTELPQGRPVSPARAPAAWREGWIAFGVVEIVLFLVGWAIEGGGFAGYSSAPGWAMIVSIILAAVVGIGGYLERKRSLRLADEAAAPEAAVLSAVPAQVPASPSAPPAPAVGTLAPDRSAWFDGSTWRDASLSPPPGALVSPDGGHWWDGATWRALPRWGVRPYGEPTPRRPWVAVGSDQAEPGAAQRGQGGSEREPGRGGQELHRQEGVPQRAGPAG